MGSQIYKEKESQRKIFHLKGRITEGGTERDSSVAPTDQAQEAGVPSGVRHQVSCWSTFGCFPRLLVGSWIASVDITCGGLMDTS